MQRSIVDLYMDGLTIEEIAEELLYDEDKVTSILRGMKKKGDNGKDYVYEFKELVVERILSGKKKGQVSKELGVAYRTINKYMEEFGVTDLDSVKNDEENMYVEINWDRFDQCPDCKSEDVNDLNMYSDDGSEELRNSYCKSCGTEWVEKGKKIMKIRWEYVR